MAEIFGSLIGIIILSIIIAGVFMWIGAKMAGIAKATFGRSILAAISVTLVTWIISGIFSLLPIIGTLIGFIIGLILSIFVIKGIFDTSFGKAFLTWVFNIIAQIVAAFVGSLIFIGGIQTLLEKLGALQ